MIAVIGPAAEKPQAAAQTALSNNIFNKLV
jgi:hypothetical protein